jgi:hypothetical protein
LGRSGALRFAVRPDDDARPDHGTRGQLAVLHLRHHLLPGGVLCRDSRLDAVEETFEPADQLGLGNPNFRVRRGFVLGERQMDPFELPDELRSQPVLELPDRAFVDGREATPRGIIQRSGLDLFQELLHHGADPHDLGGLVHQVLETAALRPGAGFGLRRPG